MTESSEHPQFTFQVSFGPADSQQHRAVFQEVSGLGLEITISEYRAGNQKEDALKITGVNKVPDVTLKRGVIGELTLGEWLQQVKEGHPNAHRDVVIRLQDENRKTVRTWTLRGARPIKYTGPALSGKGGDVAMEELVLASEAFELE